MISSENKLEVLSQTWFIILATEDKIKSLLLWSETQSTETAIRGAIIRLSLSKVCLQRKVEKGGQPCFDQLYKSTYLD